MTSIFLETLRCLLGSEYENKIKIKEALTQLNDYNRPLAEVGDSILDLIVKKKAYMKNKNSKYIDDIRKKFADKYANQKILNQDIEFAKYLRENHYTNSPIGNIGLEKADRFVEALIGAVFLEKGFSSAKVFALELLKTNPEFINEFS